MLVRALQEFAIPGAKITESDMLKDGKTGDETEVDVTIRSQVGAYPLLVSIEVNAEGRKATVEWVREMVGKHAHLPTDKLVLVNQKGFSRKARNLCEANSIEMLSLDSAATDWARDLAGEKGRLWLKQVTMWPTSVWSFVRSPDGRRLRFEARPDHSVFDADEEVTPLGEIVMTLLQRRDLGEESLLRVTRDHKSFSVECKSPKGLSMRFEDAVPAEYHTLEELKISGGIALSESTFDVEAGRIGRQNMVWGECNVEGSRKLFVVGEDLEGNMKQELLDVPTSASPYKRLTPHGKKYVPAKRGNS